MNAIAPGSTIGIFGGGQLGRFLALVAIDRGYRVHGFAPEPNPPLAAVCDAFTCAAFEDAEAVASFCRTVDVVTVEFENIPAVALEVAQNYTRVHPSVEVLRTSQNRIREKSFLHSFGIPTTACAALETDDDLAKCWATVGTPGILKTAASGYDGKGQLGFEDFESLGRAWETLKRVPCIAERRIDLATEISVLVARSERGELVAYQPLENRHRQGILDVTHWPAAISADLSSRAVAMAGSIAEALGMVGVLCVEFFVDRAGDLFVNELAPRPHNSGHLTIEAAHTSQFEQQLRAVCGLPLGSAGMRAEATMVNLLGDLWGPDKSPLWNEVWSQPGVSLHLYGKETAKPGRKMGHLTAIGGSRESRETSLSALRTRAAVKS